jgi:hypothetical protein
MKKTAARTHITLESFIQSSVVRLVRRCGDAILYLRNRTARRTILHVIDNK